MGTQMLAQAALAFLVWFVTASLIMAVVALVDLWLRGGKK